MIRWLRTSQATMSVSAAESPKPRAQVARDPLAGDRMGSSSPALGDVMQQKRHVKCGPVLEGVNDLIGQRMLFGDLAALDFAEHDRRCLRNKCSSTV